MSVETDPPIPRLSLLRFLHLYLGYALVISVLVQKLRQTEN